MNYMVSKMANYTTVDAELFHLNFSLWILNVEKIVMFIDLVGSNNKLLFIPFYAELRI